ncbi:diamine acetyltransferase 1-like [Apostichopus japonicus]|uniref:diamine acetyltransferase 1-like n=1 Tax=Stichopus japonicus TaxID=307972 RepID=UPI003AB5F4FC
MYVRAMDRYIIRIGKQEDCAEILRLIKELANHEKKGEYVNITEETLVRDGFGPSPHFKATVVEMKTGKDTIDDSTSPGGTLAGFIFYFYGYDSWKGRMVFLEDFYVCESHRGKGLGAALFHLTAKLAFADGCHSMMFYVHHDNLIAKQFYKKILVENLTQTEKWDLMELSNDHFPSYAASPLKLRDHVYLEADLRIHEQNNSDCV